LFFELELAALFVMSLF